MMHFLYFVLILYGSVISSSYDLSSSGNSVIKRSKDKANKNEALDHEANGSSAENLGNHVFNDFGNKIAKDIEDKELDKQSNWKDVEKAQAIAKVLLKSKRSQARLANLEKRTERIISTNDVIPHFLKDNIMNSFVEGRRNKKNQNPENDYITSSSKEMQNWKEEYRQKWSLMKHESLKTTSKSNQINMLGARPYGVPCGDPKQHDMPWGSCVNTDDCLPEFRIFRGDAFCGRTSYICCAILPNQFNALQTYEVSLEDKSLSTDTEERYRDKNTKHLKKHKKDRQKNRKKRKRKIKQNIQKLLKEIRKILDKLYRNATKIKAKRTKLVKKYVLKLKRQYKKDREGIRDVHEEDMMEVDRALMKKLNQIKATNQQFVKNSTFRDIVVNGTINKQGARMLRAAYPELNEYLPFQRRRSGGDDPVKKDYLDYDVEYGYIYY